MMRRNGPAHPALVLAATFAIVFAGWLNIAIAAGKQGGGAFEATKPAPVKKRTQNRPTRAETSPLSGCVRITVKVPSKKPNGENWDPPGENNRPAPDIRITNAATRSSSNVCENSLSCTWQVSNASGSLSLRVTDHDIVEHDLIGSGKCSLSSRKCNIGQVAVTLSGC